MTDLKCGECGGVFHESEWETFRGHTRYECPDCGTGRGEAYEVA